jgi:hypothetical protein
MPATTFGGFVPTIERPEKVTVYIVTLQINHATQKDSNSDLDFSGASFSDSGIQVASIDDALVAQALAEAQSEDTKSQVTIVLAASGRQNSNALEKYINTGIAATKSSMTADELKRQAWRALGASWRANCCWDS